MPAELIPEQEIPGLAAQIDSPAMLRMLQYLQRVGFIQNNSGLDRETLDILQRLARLGLVDPGYSGPIEGPPFIWVRNDNGDRMLKYLETSPSHKAALESKLRVHPRARPALASLLESDQLAVLTAAEALQGRDPASWPKDKVLRLGEDKAVYLLRVSPDLRAFIRIVDSEGIELLDIVREETLQLFRERQRAAGTH